MATDLVRVAATARAVVKGVWRAACDIPKSHRKDTRPASFDPESPHLSREYLCHKMPNEDLTPRHAAWKRCSVCTAEAEGGMESGFGSREVIREVWGAGPQPPPGTHISHGEGPPSGEGRAIPDFAVVPDQDRPGL